MENEKNSTKEFVLFKNKKRKNRFSKEDVEIIEMISKLKQDLNFVQDKLDYTTDIILIDSIIYEIKSIQKKYEFYLKLCKERGLAADNFSKIS